MSTKSFKVEQMMFNKGKVRMVDVPYIALLGEVDYDLNKIFQYGQNEIQPKNAPSLSVCDIIEWPNGDKYIIKGMGFEKLTEEMYQKFQEILRISLIGEPSLENRFDMVMYYVLGEELTKKYRN